MDLVTSAWAIELTTKEIRKYLLRSYGMCARSVISIWNDFQRCGGSHSGFVAGRHLEGNINAQLADPTKQLNERSMDPHSGPNF